MPAESLQNTSNLLANHIKLWKKRSMEKVVQFIESSLDNLIFWNVDFTQIEYSKKLFDSIYSHRITSAIPNKLLAFSRFIPASRLHVESSILVEDQINELAYECNIVEKQELGEALEYLQNLGEILWSKENNNLIVLSPIWFLTQLGHFIKNDESLANKTLSCGEIEQIWSANQLDSYYFKFLWGFLFNTSIVIPINESKQRFDFSAIKKILVPSYTLKSTEADKYHDKACYFLGREFEFDFILPGFTQRLIYTIISIISKFPTITITEQQIWQNEVDITIKKKAIHPESEVYLTIREIPSQETFSTVIQFVLSTNQIERSHFCQKIFSLGCFHIDNFVRDNYLVLYDHHMHTWILGKKTMHRHKLARVGSREHVVKTYFATRVQQIQGFKAVDLIPEIVNPKNTFTANL